MITVVCDLCGLPVGRRDAYAHVPDLADTLAAHDDWQRDLARGLFEIGGPPPARARWRVDHVACMAVRDGEPWLFIALIDTPTALAESGRSLSTMPWIGFTDWTHFCRRLTGE